MAGEISESSPAAVKEASVELPAPAGWKKKFTPKKGGTPRRNVIVFISPTGEEITNKKQLDQYIRAHPEGPSSSEFDWRTGDTPQRSARLKAKPTESPEGEKPTKRERKSSGNEGKADKKDAEVGENEAIKAAEDAAAAGGAQESTGVEMKDAEGNADKAGKVHAEANADKAEGEEVSKTVVEGGKEAEQGNQEKEVSMTLEGKEDENADKKMEDSEILIPTSEAKENANADKEKLEDSASTDSPAQTGCAGALDWQEWYQKLLSLKELYYADLIEIRDKRKMISQLLEAQTLALQRPYLAGKLMVHVLLLMQISSKKSIPIHLKEKFHVYESLVVRAVTYDRSQKNPPQSQGQHPNAWPVPQQQPSHGSQMRLTDNQVQQDPGASSASF